MTMDTILKIDGTDYPFTMSSVICSACRVRYLPKRGRCVCAAETDEKSPPRAEPEAA